MAMCHGPYSGKQVALGTMHGKEAAFVPVLRDRLGMSVWVPTGINTDSLGTFTGEIPRNGTIRDIAVAKARLAMDATRLRIGVASEGSYGPHPTIPFIAGGIELVVLVDDIRGSIVTDHFVDDAPAFAHQTVSHVDEIDPFLSRAGFPLHALIVRPNSPSDGAVEIAKAVQSHDALATAIDRSVHLSSDGLAMVQNDMRAHLNPTRMAAIRNAVARLAERVATLCPHCRSPGYGLVDVEKGLACEECGGPSTLPRWRIFGCMTCGHTERRPVVSGPRAAPAMYCQWCNP